MQSPYVHYGVPVVTNYKINSISRVYAFINNYLVPDGRKAIADFELNFGDLNSYRLIALIGSGKYSLVFLGKTKTEYCAIKVLKSDARIKRELFILDRVACVSGVIRVLGVNKDDLTDSVSIVTEYVRADPPKNLYSSLSLDEIRYYMFLLLCTLDGCHSRGVMHRDVKPGNVCIDHENKKLRIIDWGLSDLYYPRTQYSVRVATLRYKAPELLLGYRFYDYGVDVWGAGCIFAEMIFELGFIKGNNAEEVLGSIAKLWGRSEIDEYCEKYGIELTPGFERALSGKTKPGWRKAARTMRVDVQDSDALDLIMKMLTIDHRERITMREALRHAFFAPLFV